MKKNLLDMVHYGKDIRLEMIEAIKKSENPIIIYGAAKYADLMTKYLLEYEIEISAYAVDSDYYIENMTFHDRPVYDILQIHNFYEKYEVIIGFEDHKRALEAVERLKKEEIPTYYFRDPFYFRYMDYGFFLKNSNKYQAAYDLLEDDLSRNIFTAHLNSRITGNVQEIAKYNSGSPYEYDYPLMELGDNEIFVDCGALNGDTIIDFLSYTDGKVNHIYSFEPDAENAKAIYQNVHLGEVLTVIEKGVGNQDGTAAFYSEGTTGSNFVHTGVWGGKTRRDLYEDEITYVPITKIDTVLNGIPVTAIKMDVEGSELDALQGAQETIRKHHPKLAVCVYHKQEDLFTIIQYIHSLDEEACYKYYLRHQSDDLYDTVLYALPQKKK